MNHLPVEVLHEIFIKLDLNEKLECMRVCQFWYEALDRRNLLHTLTITHRVFLKLKEMIERRPYRATQVEYLTLFLDLRVEFDKRILCNMFPNLRELILSHNWMHTREPANYMSNTFQFTHSTSKLEKIKDFGECKLIRQPAMSNLCNKLKSLELNSMGLPRLSSSDILSQLENLPVLEIFDLINFDIKLTDLEMLHNNLSSIKSLYFSNVRIISGEIPLNIIPAASVTALHLEFDADGGLQVHIQFYKYLGKKYPLVKNPVFIDEGLDYKDDEYVKELYKEGIFPLYRIIGHQTDSFTLSNYRNGLDAFNKFDEFGMKLKELSIQADECPDALFLEELAQSNQSKYIQKLHLYDIVPDPINIMNSMIALEILDIHCSSSFDEHNNIINFNQFIDACPAKLAKLTITYTGLTYNQLTTHPNCIQYLSLKDMELTPDLARAIEIGFPKLVTLELEGDLTNNQTISLPNHHFKEVTLTMKSAPGKPCRLVIKTVIEGKSQCQELWSTHGNVMRGKIRMNIVTVPLPSETPALTFSCASIEELNYSFEQTHDTD